jgi:hypothetical protein
MQTMMDKNRELMKKMVVEDNKFLALNDDY